MFFIKNTEEEIPPSVFLRSLEQVRAREQDLGNFKIS
jgi:hypothetical protein